MWIGYPVIPTPAGPVTIDATLVSPDHGVVAFDLVEGTNLGAYQDRQDDLVNQLSARLISNKELVNKRELRISVEAITFDPRGGSDQSSEPNAEYPLADSLTLGDILAHCEWPTHDPRIFETAVSVISNVSTIRRSRARPQTETGRRGAAVQTLEQSIATLDNIQTRAFLETVDGVQRIRGLAGSGKTVVLARKAAYLHATHPDWRIAVTYHTRSLREHFRRLISTFSIAESGQEPDWERLQVLPSWGAPGRPDRDGLYHQFCLSHGIQYRNYNEGKQLYGAGNSAFKGVCEAALREVAGFKQLFDVILVDEAQDLPPAFLKLCFEILRPPKRLVYAYDELQTLSGKGLPAVSEIFGDDDRGRPRVSFSAQNETPLDDVILEKCYRNSRPVLSTAHAFGFGVYREAEADEGTGLVQMFDEPHLWTDIGYRVAEGSLSPGEFVALERTPETSPRFLEDHSPIDDLVVVKHFDDKSKQDDWVANQIAEDLQLGLRYDDIIVINTDPLTTGDNLGPLRRLLLERGIDSHLAGVDTSPDVFFRDTSQSITFTGIYRAKGNEGAMVYIVHGEECFGQGFNLARIRNRLFTAVTRSKAWVRILGVGPRMAHLEDEFLRLQSNGFQLRFTYPTEAQRQQLEVLHRDMDPRKQRKLGSDQKSTRELIEGLVAGDIYLEDLDEDLQPLMRRLLDDLKRR